jgi:hypothetical protein
MAIMGRILMTAYPPFEPKDHCWLGKLPPSASCCLTGKIWYKFLRPQTFLGSSSLPPYRCVGLVFLWLILALLSWAAHPRAIGNLDPFPLCTPGDH